MTYQTEGIILRRWDYKEADRMIRLLTPDRGKLTVRAISVRKPGAKLISHTEPFVHTEVFIAGSKTIDILANSRVISAHSSVRGSLDKIAVAHILTEIVDRFTQDQDADPVLFEMVRDQLQWLETHQPHPLVLYAAIVQLLAQLGYHLGLYECVHCKKSITDQGLVFHYELWNVGCATCLSSDHSSAIAGDTIKLLRFFSEHVAADAARLQLSDAQWQNLNAFMRSLLNYHVDGGLRSWEVWEQTAKQL
jgi:DNA repair protein RecO (recombination protein O)